MKNVYLYLLLLFSAGAYSQACGLNGGFETPLTTLPTPYSFTTSTGAYSVAQCNLAIAGTPFTGTVPLNNFGTAASVSLVSPANEPLLASLGVTSVSTVNTGTRAIKLNASPVANDSDDNGVTNITTMSKVFTATASAVDFSFSLIVKDGGHSPAEQPFFRVRLYDSAGTPINTNQICIQTDPDNCIFSQLATSTDPVLYTGWQCARINIPSEYINQTVRLEFVMADCGGTAHNGTVYIDDICTTNCSNPAFGSIQLNPVNQNCPASAFTVCGTYLAPPNSTYSSMSLEITQNGSTVSTITTPSSLTSGTFCFTVNPSAFGLNPTGNYGFEVNAVFSINCSPTPYPLIIFDTTDGVSFNNCCIPNLVITISPTTTDLKEAQISIMATNTINNSITALYHAGTTVVLKPGFKALTGSKFRGYIEECGEGFEFRPAATAEEEAARINMALIDDQKIMEAQQRKSADKLLYPNPASEMVTVMAGKAIVNITVTALDGTTVFNKDISDGSISCDINVKAFKKGFYIVNIACQDGSIRSEKLIKE